MELPERAVEITSLQVVRYDPPDLEIEMRCSSGTYVRSLARDIGTALGTVAHVVALRRTSVGPFGVGEATLPDAATESQLIAPGLFVARLDTVDSCRVASNHLVDVRQGKPPRACYFLSLGGSSAYVAALDDGGELVALLTRDTAGSRGKKSIQYAAVFAAPGRDSVQRG